MVDLSTAPPAVGITPKALAGFGASLNGDLHLPGTARYTELTTPWNVAVHNAPAAVVEAHDARDVVAAVALARTAGLQVSVQSTGHGASEYARPTLQISTTAMNELSISPDGVACCGPGVVWSQVIARAAPLGFAGLAGSAPDVGVVGFLTGGGLGPVARTYGVSADYVTALYVVTGDAQVRWVTCTENPDLFWGLRGGKGALGVVTGVEFDLVPLPKLLGGCLYFDGADAPAVLRAWREWTANLPEQTTSSIAIMRLPAMPAVPAPLADKTTVAVRFAWVGDPAEGRRVLADIACAGRQVFGGVATMPYADIGMIHNDPVDPMPVCESSTLLQHLSPETIDTLLQLTGPEAKCPQVIVELRHLGGAISRSQGGASAFSHRDAAYALTTIGLDIPPVAETTRRHASALLTAIAPWSDGSCLPNFAATTDPTEVARKYDSATLTRLARLAAAYDPDQVIAAAEPIRIAANLRLNTRSDSVPAADHAPPGIDPLPSTLIHQT
jgi:hypothetical protein